MVLNRDQILSAEDKNTELVNVPEWGGDVLISTMTGSARDAFEAALVNGKANSLENIRAKFAAATIVDEEGNRLFKDSDIKELGNKSAAALDRVFTAAQRLNRFSDQDVEDLAKN